MNVLEAAMLAGLIQSQPLFPSNLKQAVREKRRPGERARFHQRKSDGLRHGLHPKIMMSGGIAQENQRWTVIRELDLVIDRDQLIGV
jgi:hypothetical protein